MKIVLDPSANAEMRDAAFFYEGCRDGLGQEFLDAVELAFGEIACLRRRKMTPKMKCRSCKVNYLP